MPRITEQQKEFRRAQILEAARACILDSGLEAVSMEMIVERSGLSTGAVYGYFKGKEDIVHAVVTEGTAQLSVELRPLLTNTDPPPPPEFISSILKAVADFSTRERGADRLLVAIHGWSHSQSSPELRAATRAAYRGLRTAYAKVATRWKENGTLDPSADANQIAELLMSITLGFVAQRALTGSASIQSHTAALALLSRHSVTNAATHRR